MTCRFRPTPGAARGGFAYVELLVAVLLVAIASIAAVTSWVMTTRMPATKRVTEMGVFVAMRELERWKARKYMGLPDTPANAPQLAYFNRYGGPESGPVARGYKAKTWITPWVNRDGTVNTEDLREIKVEVRSNDEATLYETARTMLTFGGL